MLSFLPKPLSGALAFLAISLNTLLIAPPLILLALLKLLIPWGPWRKLCTQILMVMATGWVSANGAISSIFFRIHWDIRGVEGLSTKQWYLVISNHQSWVDIPVVQKALNGHAPFLKFFLKQELFWVPILGVAWWALDFPFMKRYSRAQVRANKGLKGIDLERTRKASEKFRMTPVSIFNFLEGTRFTKEKHSRQQSPYEHLLKPRAGGAAFVIGAMGEQVRTVLDVTIVYPGGRPTLWHFLCGEVHTIVVDVRVMPIPDAILAGDYSGDEVFKREFQQWIGEIWQAKDDRIETLLVQTAERVRN